MIYTKIGMNYLRWHYIKAPKFIVFLIGNYLFFIGHFFSVKLLLKTLFSPWRKLTAQKEKPGINFGDILNVFAFNAISRVLGLIVRTISLFLSLIFFILVLVLGVFILLAWLFIPIITLPIYLNSQNPPNPRKKSLFIETHLEENPKPEDVNEVSEWYERSKTKEEKKSQFWTKENLSSIPGIGRNWSFGYTLNLNKFSEDLARSSFSLEKFIGRQEDINNLQRILIKNGTPDVLLVGDAGIGKKTIVIGLAKLIYEGKCFSPLLYKRILMLNMDSMISSVEGQTEKNLIGIFKEAKDAGNIILVIPSFERFVNLSPIFSEYLGGKNIQVIGITNPNSYEKYVLPNQTLEKLFEKLDVSEIGKDKALVILEDLALDYEKKYKISVSYQALLEIIKQTDSLITDIPFPEKAINLLDEAASFASQNGKNKLTKEEVDSILSSKTKIPIGQLNAQDTEKLKNLEAVLHQRVIGQDYALEEISQALKRRATGVNIKNATIGSFLFLGPTGVGKTHTAKALAQVYFGDENKMVRLDMSEFQTEKDIEKLIGGGENPGILTSKVRENPFGVVLLDEFEKGNQKILNLFLTVFDEGYLTDGFGKKVNFKNSIIIATSNAGSEFIREEIKKGTPSDNLEKLLVEYLFSQKIFSPELINRFDSVIFYKPLTKEEIEKVAELLLSELNKKLKDEKDLTVAITPNLLSKLIELGYDETFGARNMQRVIEEKIENEIAKKILEGSTKRGDNIELDF